MGWLTQGSYSKDKLCISSRLLSFTLNLPETETTGPRIKVFKRMRHYICDCFTPGNGKWAFFCALKPSDAERKTGQHSCRKFS